MSNNKALWVVVALLAAAVVVIAGVLISEKYKPNQNEPSPGKNGTVCTMEAKQCPDGSYVGRVGPSCEFAPCPAAGANIKVY